VTAAKRFDRHTAMSGRPVQTPPVRVDERDNGGAVVTVRLKRRRAFRWFGGPDEVEQSFGLDPLGSEVYEACDGTADVAAIVRRFAKTHKVSRSEAEIAVTTFLKTLMTKGLVVMAIDEDKLRKKP